MSVVEFNLVIFYFVLCLGFYITFLAILQIVLFILFLYTKPRSLKKRVPSKGHGLPGRLIVIEGLDGSGKSTQLYLLQGKFSHILSSLSLSLSPFTHIHLPSRSLTHLNTLSSTLKITNKLSYLKCVNSLKFSFQKG
jgi:hypothetical protein